MEGIIDKAFLGKGWGFPVELNDSQDVKMAAYEEDIRQAIRIILETNHGERVMRPDFGANLQAMVFEPINTTTKALIKHRVETALITWEPRIDSIEVQINNNRSTPSHLTIEIDYRIRATNTFYNLVYPFYLQEGDS